MKITPRSDQELSSLIPEGDYILEVIHSEEKISKTSNKEMFHFKFKAYTSAATGVTIEKYIVVTAEKILKDFCYAFGLNHEYDTGLLDEKYCLGKFGKAHIIVEPESTGVKWDEVTRQNKTVNYPPKNAIQYFIRGKWTRTDIGCAPQGSLKQEFNNQQKLYSQPAHTSDLNPPPFQDDDIPF
jgi:hypothetical protein